MQVQKDLKPTNSLTGSLPDIEQVDGQTGLVGAIGLSAKMMFCYLISHSSTIKTEVALIFSDIEGIKDGTLILSASI